MEKGEGIDCIYPDNQDSKYRNFEESFGRRFANKESRFSHEDKTLIKSYWTEAVETHHSDQDVPETTKFMRVKGTDNLVVAVRHTHEDIVMNEALSRFRQKRLEEIKHNLDRLNTIDPTQHRYLSAKKV